MGCIFQPESFACLPQENNDQTVVTVVIAVIIVAILASVIGFAVHKSRAKPAAAPVSVSTLWQNLQTLPLRHLLPLRPLPNKQLFAPAQPACAGRVPFGRWSRRHCQLHTLRK